MAPCRSSQAKAATAVETLMPSRRLSSLTDGSLSPGLSEPFSIWLSKVRATRTYSGVAGSRADGSRAVEALLICTGRCRKNEILY
jgi:hypothetical protein